jgi:hypothetical protein
MDQDLEQDQDQDSGYINHNFTWMPSEITDCPCDECQDHIDREAALERESIWPWRLNWRVHLLKGGKPATCPCGEYLKTVQDFNPKKKEMYLHTEPHIMVQVYGKKSLGDGIYYPGVSDVAMHLKCGARPINPDDRSAWDMETQSMNVLILESLPGRAITKIRNLSIAAHKSSA